MYFYFWDLLLNFEKGKGKKFEESKRTKRKRAETKEDKRRKANKLSKNQNQGNGRIGQPTKKLRDEQNLRKQGSERGNKWLS